MLRAVNTLQREIPGADEVISRFPTILKFQQGIANRERVKAYFDRNVYAK